MISGNYRVPNNKILYLFEFSSIFQAHYRGFSNYFNNLVYSPGTVYV